MGHLKDIVGEGGTVHRFVTTPFMADTGLKAEVQTQWVLASDMTADAFRAKFYWVTRKDWNNRDMERKTHVVPVFERQFVEAIKVPEQSVLYILGHSDTNVAEIGGRRGPVKADGMDWWTPLQLVQWLTPGPQPLPRRMLCVKIWSCYSATNGFLAEFSRQMVRAGYRDTICVGYTAITGAMYGTPVESHPPHTKAMLAPNQRRRCSGAERIFE